MTALTTRTLLPRPTRRRTRFALTPLADAMFQLLIFFMLSSSLAPYSLMTLRAGGGPGGGTDEALAAPQGPVALWKVTRGAILAGGQRFGIDTLPALAAGLAQSPNAAVTVIASEAARVQDLATVLEALTVAGVARVTVANGVVP